MASHESLPEAALGRSSSMDARDILSRSDSQRKAYARRSHRAGNDLFVCFASRTSLNLVSRPVLSPSRDKGKDVGRRGRALSSSIFSKAAKKQEFDIEEPTSPKVTCIGQVRVRHKKKNKPRTLALEADALRKGKAQRLSRNSESPSFCNTEATNKEQDATSACSRFGKDFPCFALPCDSYGSLPSFRGNKKACGAVFAKSLVLIQDTDGKPDSKTDLVEPTAAETSGSFEIHRNEKILPGPQETETSPPAADVHFEEEEEEDERDDFVIPPAEATSSVAGDSSISKVQDDAVSEPKEEDYDTFEPEPPPPNALLLMRLKSSRLRVVVPPPSVNIVLKRSTSAPAQCRMRRSTKVDNNEIDTGLEDGKENGHMENKLAKTRISEEDLPKRNSLSFAQKYFLTRCKSVSQSFSRSNGSHAFVEPLRIAAPAEKETPEAASGSQDVNQVESDSSETASFAVDARTNVPESSESASLNRSGSESLKVSLDVVPETWLWETCTVARPKKESIDQQRERRRGVEWLDTDLEASLRKSCSLGESLTSDVNAPSQRAEWQDAKTEASLCRRCQDSEEVEEMNDESLQSRADVEGRTVELSSRRTSTELFEEVAMEKRDEYQGSTEGCCDALSVQEILSADVEERMGKLSSKRTSTELLEEVAMEKQDEYQGGTEECCNALSVQEMEVEGNELEGLSSVSQLETVSPYADVEDDEKLTCEDNHQKIHTDANVAEQNALVLEFISDGGETSKKQQLETAGYYPADEVDTVKLQQLERRDSRSHKEGNMEQQQEKLVGEIHAEQQHSAERPPAPAAITHTFQCPSTTDALLFLRYNVGALRLSVHGSDLNPDAEKLVEREEQQHKVMLKAMSHFHEVGSCARLLKAASGREPGHLPSALRLQRCKSEPVRSTS